MPWSRTLSTNWTAAGMFWVYWPTKAARGLSSAAVDHLIGIGYSFRIQAIRRQTSFR